MERPHVLLLGCLVALTGVGCDVLDASACEERRRAGLCLSKPLETAHLCPQACEGHLVQSKVRRRVSVDRAVTGEVCAAVLNLQRAIRPGDGYGGQRYPHTPYELFGGITPKAAAHWAVSLANEEARAGAIADVRVLIKAVRRVKGLAQYELAAVDPDLSELHLDYVQLACRERVTREDLPGEVLEPPDSMAIHADNCWRDEATDMCRREKPFFHWRTHSAHLYLSGAGEGGGFQGGDFFFSDRWDDPLKGGRRVAVPPQCGRLVAFTAGPENLHGVNPLDRGIRCALSVWMTTDAERATATEELETAEAVLAGNATAIASMGPLPDITEFYEGCAAAAESDMDLPILEEVERQVGSQTMTFQVLHREPQLTRVLNFLSVAETEALIGLAAPRMAPSVVFEGDELATMNYRNSQTAWLTPADLEGVLGRENLTERIGRVTGLSLESAEDIQIAFYSGDTQGKYEPHMDWGVDDPEEVRREDFTHQAAPGGRLATFLVFLNDVPSGGHTAFPGLGLHVKPQAGSALLWYNLVPGETGSLGDMLTRHGGCPVIRGLKYIATKWIHERGNEELLHLPAGSISGYIEREWRTLTTAITDPEDDSDGVATACDGEGDSEQCRARGD